jgi:hypothetical protein
LPPAQAVFSLLGVLRGKSDLFLLALDVASIKQPEAGRRRFPGCSAGGNNADQESALISRRAS